MTPSSAFWSGKRVLLTGHTGFKGGWLSLWLAELGAQVHGFALAPPTSPSLFEVANVGRSLASHMIGDVRDFDVLNAAVEQARPDVVIHMAAQPLVRASYTMPVETYATNVMGTVHLLEAVRRIGSVSALVNVTTDKCYENNEWLWPYREDERLGGHDPYSNSKACAELVTAAYRSSFHTAGRPFIGTARAGNVIGGGDWALDRIIPDALRSLDAGTMLEIRSPRAIRPWQHVLEPLSGYLTLAEHLATDGAAFAMGWNFGPADRDTRSVEWILARLTQLAPALRWAPAAVASLHEANVLRLDSSRAHGLLGWRPRWTLSRALEQTMAWHLAWRHGDDPAATSLAQIRAYMADAAVDG